MLLSGLATCAQAQEVTVVIYPNSGIFEVDNGPVRGPGATLLARLQSVSGVRLHTQVLPVARALQPAALKPGTCLVGLPRTPDREAQYRWAGPWTSSTFALYARTEDARKVASADDLRGTRVAVLRESLTASWLKEQGPAGYEVNDVATGLRILQAGRVDYWLGNDVVTRFAIKAGIAGPTPRVLHNFGRIDLHMACHPGTATPLVERLHAGIEQLRRGGELVEFGLGR